jgi:hypothetical protein
MKGPVYIEFDGCTQIIIREKILIINKSEQKQCPKNHECQCPEFNTSTKQIRLLKVINAKKSNTYNKLSVRARTIQNNPFPS